MDSLRTKWNKWYEAHSSTKDEFTFGMAITIGLIVLGVLLAGGLLLLGNVFPVLASIIGIVLVAAVALCGLVYWGHYIFSIKDPMYKPDHSDDKGSK